MTEAINSALLATLNPGDELLIIEPAHENFIPSAIFAGATPVAVALEPPDYRLDRERLAAAITPRTRALLLNTPHNPTGRMFDEEELGGIIDLVLQNDLVLITDEIYDRIVYDGRTHQPPGGLEPLRERTITINGLSKTFAVTGWRLGYAIAPTQLTAAIRPVHDFLTICAPAPLQYAAAAALSLDQGYYEQMAADYHERRAVTMEILEQAGFAAPTPEGAYYVLASYDGVPSPQANSTATDFSIWMVKHVGVAVVPGTVFYSLPGYGERSVRFAFPKKIETLQRAGEYMLKMANVAPL